MNKKIAIPSENGILAAHFGHCAAFSIFKTEGKEIIKKTIIDAPPHQPGLLPRFLAEKGVTDVIAGGIGQKAITLFNQHGINVFAGAPQEEIQTIAKGFLNSTIEFSANYCDH